MIDIEDMASVNHSTVSARIEIITSRRSFVYSMLQIKSSNGQMPEHNSFQDYPAARAMH